MRRVCPKCKQVLKYRHARRPCDRCQAQDIRAQQRASRESLGRPQPHTLAAKLARAARKPLDLPPTPLEIARQALSQAFWALGDEDGSRGHTAGLWARYQKQARVVVQLMRTAS